MGPQRSARRSIRDALAIVAIAAALLILAELALRVVPRIRTGVWPVSRATYTRNVIAEYNAFYRKHPWLHTAPAGGARFERVAGQLSHASWNQQGYRSPERPVERPPGVRRLLVSGGSTTFDVLAPDDASSWPWQLERRLQAGGDSVEVWNAGMPTWTSVENLISFAIRDADLEPDVALLYQSINDLQPASQQPFDPQYERHAELTRSSLGFDLAPLPLGQRLLLIDWLRNVFGIADAPPPSLTPARSDSNGCPMQPSRPSNETCAVTSRSDVRTAHACCS
jgi:hypothetical protein